MIAVFWMSLEGRNVILFGAGALAQGYAPLFADQASNIMIVSRGESAKKLAESLSGRKANVTWHRENASNYDGVEAVYDLAVRDFGEIDVVVNGAGGNRKEAVVSSLEDFVGMDPSVPGSLIDSNYMSKRHSLTHFARVLMNQENPGSVVNITSMSGLQPLSKVIDYSAAYAAVENLTRSVAALYGQAGIGRVNNVAVGFTIGEQNRDLLMKDPQTPTDRGEEILSSTSMGRFLDKGEVAPSVLYLADSDTSGAINGATIDVSGGYNLIGLPNTAGYDRE